VQAHMKIKAAAVLALAVLIALTLTTGYPSRPAATGGLRASGRFDRAERLSQFIRIERSADCKGTIVTIEKVLLDRTGTFMIASVKGPLQGRMDDLCVDLFDGEGRELGRSTFLEQLPGGKTLLTFKPVASAPQALRLEFFGGPVGYEGNVSLELKDINFKTVDQKYTRTYQLAEVMNANGYRLLVDAVTAGISETQLHYRLDAQGDYDGIIHGWLYDYNNNYNPEGEILSMSDSGCQLKAHLFTTNCPGPYYRYSLDGKTAIGQANFDPLTTSSVQVKLTDIYGCYTMNEIVPLDRLGNTIALNKKISVSHYTVDLKSLAREGGSTWMLDYSVLDTAGHRVAAAIEAGIYSRADGYRQPLVLFSRFQDATAGDRRLLLDWDTSGGGDLAAQEPALKITRLGIRLQDAALDINLDSPKKRPDDSDERAVMAAVNDYYGTTRVALTGDGAAMENKYGYLIPTGKEGDGINDWRRFLDTWRPYDIKDYSVDFDEPIITIAGNTATADLGVLETLTWGEHKSQSAFRVVFSLARNCGHWRITRVDEVTGAETGGGL